MTRAYAVQNLALMLFRYGTPDITTAVFQDEPYRSLFVSKNLGLSYRQLFDYAASIYPLAVSELYSAMWYANGIIGHLATLEEYEVVIHEKLERAEKDIERLRGIPSQSYTFLNALELRATLLGKMARVRGALFPDPDKAFEELFDIYETHNWTNDGTARYAYAAYLANRQGASRLSDIRDTLAPLYENIDSRGRFLRSPLVKLRDTPSFARLETIKLASTDSKFKALLLQLGWRESDLASQ